MLFRSLLITSLASIATAKICCGWTSLRSAADKGVGIFSLIRHHFKDISMGDYSDFCQSYCVCVSDPEFMDKWLNQYTSGTESISKFISKKEELHFKSEYGLSDIAWQQVKEYVSIYRDNSFTKHHEVNNYITNNGLWGRFTEMRSMNDHGNDKVVKGITRMYFRLICELLKITGEDGDPLINAEKY